MNVTGLAMDWIEAIADATDDPESRPAGFADPHFPVSPKVTLSRDHGLYVYHLDAEELGQGSSFGNASAWAETKGTGSLLGLYSIEAGCRVLGGMSLAYLLPFSDLSTEGFPAEPDGDTHHSSFAHALPSVPGSVHLHPAYQQREFVIGDGLHVLETLFVPRTGMEDPAVVHQTVVLVNRASHPIGVTVVAGLALRGHTPLDVCAAYDRERGCLVAWNKSEPDWVRVFGASGQPEAYWATTDQEEAYSPGRPLPNRTDEVGDLTGALQFDVILLPGSRHKIRFAVAFSPRGRREALRVFDAARSDGSLKKTIEHYNAVIRTGDVEMPDAMLTQGVQWAKACLIRPLSRYPIGECFTNDPGRSKNIVSRDSAWYVYGCDFVRPDASCSLLHILAKYQRDDGLIPEYVDGNTGKPEDLGFNINDDTPLFLMAVAHHVQTAGHEECLRSLYEPARRAGERILACRDERGLVKCTADGMGAHGICGWRNVLANDRISGVVTELNCECYAALRALGTLAEAMGQEEDAAHYRGEADELRRRINECLANPENGLYVRNISLDGHTYTQVTADLVFPLICGVADPDKVEAISSRLSETDFMTEAGLRVLPSGNPSYDPSFESGCLGGVWPGVTWWYAMGCCHANPHIMADSLRRSYSHYIIEPKTYNTVPGQFSEWCDGETLVNRGMRLSPWEPPRFLWAAIEGLAGVTTSLSGVSLVPRMPSTWSWLRVHNLPHRGRALSFFLIRQNDGLHAYTCDTYGGDLTQHRYDEELPHGTETLMTGLTTTALRKDKEVVVLLGSALPEPALGPFLAHHALDAGAHYRVFRLTNQQEDWEELGVLPGSHLQRISVRIQAGGYAVYRFLQDG